MIKSYFQWDQEFTTGLEIVDQQHQHLVALINEALQLSFDRDHLTVDKVKHLKKELSNYVAEHFATEEILMKHHHLDPRYVIGHLKLHEEFNAKVNSYFADVDMLISSDQLGEVIEYLIRWLAYHILNTDKSMTRQIEMITQEHLTPEEAFNKDITLVEHSTEPLLKALKALFFIISEKNRELEKANQELEDKVLQRTSELESAYERLEEISLLDELTGLYNRRYAIKEMEKSIYEYQRYANPFSLLFIDLDHFKQVNDSFGHDHGDLVLRWVTEHIIRQVRKSDIVCRLGGDEFVIISKHCNADAATALANKIINTCDTSDCNAIQDFWKPAFSIGIVEVDDAFTTVSDLLNKADQEMYKVKKAGGGHISVFSR